MGLYIRWLYTKIFIMHFLYTKGCPWVTRANKDFQKFFILHFAAKDGGYTPGITVSYSAADWCFHLPLSTEYFVLLVHCNRVPTSFASFPMTRPDSCYIPSTRNAGFGTLISLKYLIIRRFTRLGGGRQMTTRRRYAGRAQVHFLQNLLYEKRMFIV